MGLGDIFVRSKVTLVLELELELIQSHLTQKPMLRGEVDAHALLCSLVLDGVLSKKVLVGPKKQMGMPSSFVCDAPGFRALICSLVICRNPN